MSFWVFIAVMALWTAAFFAPNLRWGRKDVMKDGKRQPAPRDEVEKLRAAIRERVAKPMLARHKRALFRRDS
jgi:hypothetical protein